MTERIIHTNTKQTETLWYSSIKKKGCTQKKKQKTQTLKNLWPQKNQQAP